MSFILDALKKSEAERQRQASPGLLEPAIVRARGGPTPLTIGLLVLLGVNSLVLGFVLLRRPPANPPASARPAATVARLPGAVSSPGATRSSRRAAAPTGAPAASESASSGMASASPRSAAPLPGTAPVGASAAPSSDEAAGFAPEVPVNSPDNPIVAEARERLSAAGAAPSTPGDRTDLEALPTLAQMHFSGADALPPLHLDVHVYSPNPAQRFVFINGHKYVEGSTLAEGPRVLRIRPDGVELAYRGSRFLLPRR